MPGSQAARLDVFKHVASAAPEGLLHLGIEINIDIMHGTIFLNVNYHLLLSWVGKFFPPFLNYMMPYQCLLGEQRMTEVRQRRNFWLT